MAPALSKRIFNVLLIASILCAHLGCEPAAQVRVYEAPKSESTFVTGPLSGSESRSFSSNSPSSGSATVGPKRILGAIIPTDEGCYFLKATDSPERLEPLLADIQTMVESFAVDPQTGRPSSQLPQGWVLNPRNDIAIAELISPESTGQVKFTVTALAMPSEQQWAGYLLSNVNRWRGQLKLPELTSDTLLGSLLEVSRGSSPLPAYIFDATGTGSGTMSPPGASVNAPESRGDSPTKETTSQVPSTPSKRPTLEYDLPEGWSVGQGSQFRLATLNIQSDKGRGEVTVSMATDDPQANTMMWFQQVAQQADPAKLQPLVEKTIQSAEKFSVGDQQATLYEIRIDQQDTAPSLLVVSVPTDTPQMHLFVKLIGENQLTTDQKEKLIQFVQSLSIK